MLFITFMILSSIFTTLTDAFYFGYKEPVYKSKKKKLILFFHPFGNRFTNYFLKVLLTNMFSQLLPDYHFEEYYYDDNFTHCWYATLSSSQSFPLHIHNIDHRNHLHHCSVLS